MADEVVYKKVTRKADKGLEGKVVAKHGKQTNQKLKPYVVLEYFLNYSDENNTKSAYDIIGYLEGCGISAERRSIYRDIEDINRIMLMLQEDIDLDEVDMMFAEAEESGDEEEVNDLKTILYDKNKKEYPHHKSSGHRNTIARTASAFARSWTAFFPAIECYGNKP